jgi:hypothetical protein
LGFWDFGFRDFFGIWDFGIWDFPPFRFQSPQNHRHIAKATRITAIRHTTIRLTQ